MELNKNEQIVLDLITKDEMPANEIKALMKDTEAPEGMVHLILSSLSKKGMITIDKGEGFKNISLSSKIDLPKEVVEKPKAKVKKPVKEMVEPKEEKVILADPVYVPLFSAEDFKNETRSKKIKKMIKKNKKHKAAWEIENKVVREAPTLSQTLSQTIRSASVNPSAYTGTIPKGKYQEETSRISSCAACMDLFYFHYIKTAKRAFELGTLKDCKKQFIADCATHGINPSTANVHWAKSMKEHNIKGKN